MNVLVYSGPGVSSSVLKHTLASLRSILSPFYSVQTVPAETLSSNVWCPSCALLVVSGVREGPYLTSLKHANKCILDYVEGGGRYLGLCGGAYYASASVEWETDRPEMGVTGARPLRFFPGLSKGCTYPNSEHSSESGARLSSILANDGFLYRGLYYNGGGEFMDAETFESVQVLAYYTSDSHVPTKVAGVLCSYGKGAAALWGVHLEFSLMVEPLNSLLNGSEARQLDRRQWEKDRMKLLAQTLSSLGLKIPRPNSRSYLRPLPQYFVCISELDNLPSSSVRDVLAYNLTTTKDILHDENDIFHFHEYSHDLVNDLVNELETGYGSPGKDLDTELTGTKHIILCDSKVPRKVETPLFDISLFFTYLKERRCQFSLPPPTPEACGIGSLLLYSEAVTSTQTLLDRNPILMKGLPAPLMSLATHQLSGRGRGDNVWLSPAGCLQFSLLLKTSLSPGSSPYPYLRVPSVVFVQYLMGMAVVAGCRPLLGSNGMKVRLKWPNDVYGLMESAKKKLGGIIVTTSFSEGVTSIVIGCGVNVLSDLPATSLSALIDSHVKTLKMEEVASNVVSQFEKLWYRFIKEGGSFKVFLDEYLEYWLHSDELVTITTTNPHTKARITGITLDYGLLRTIPISEEWNSNPTYIDLQPDGNSFDMMAGLIKRKT